MALVTENVTTTPLSDLLPWQRRIAEAALAARERGERLTVLMPRRPGRAVLERWLQDNGLIATHPTTLAPAAVAQGLEQGAHNASGAGSSPARRTEEFDEHDDPT